MDNVIFLEVLEWMDPTGEEIIHRIPEEGSAEIKLGAQCIVRESQSAVFFRNGKACDSLGPGRHTLTSLNLPILTKVLSLPWGFTSPFRAEVYFINHKVFTRKWGTRDPVAFRDKELGLVRLRGHGTYVFQVVEPLLFLNTIVGRQAIYTSGEIEDFFRDILISRFNDLMGEKLETILNLPRQYKDFAEELTAIVRREFLKYGVDLKDFYIASITPPDEVQRMIDQRSGLEAVGDLDRFLKFELARGMGQSPSGAAGAALGLGAGVALVVPSLLSKALAPSQKDLRDDPLPTIQCPECGADTPEHSRFCYKCGHQLVVIDRCPQCGKNLPVAANFCLKCGYDLRTRLQCPKCQTALPHGTKFCFRCGEKLASS